MWRSWAVSATVKLTRKGNVASKIFGEVFSCAWESVDLYVSRSMETGFRGSAHAQTALDACKLLKHLKQNMFVIFAGSVQPATKETRLRRMTTISRCLLPGISRCADCAKS